MLHSLANGEFASKNSAADRKEQSRIIARASRLSLANGQLLHIETCKPVPAVADVIRQLRQHRFLGAPPPPPNLKAPPPHPVPSLAAVLRALA